MEFQPEVDLDFSLNIFKTIFIDLARPLDIGLLGMVFEHLSKKIDQKDSTDAFSHVFLPIFKGGIGYISTEVIAPTVYLGN
jgi:hypothetical protein